MDFVLSMLQDKEEVILFVVLFLNLVGVFLKNKTKLNNDYIPMVLMGLGLLIGWFLVDKSIYGVIAGAMCSFTSTGVHQGMKTTKNLIVDSVEDVIDKRKEDEHLPEVVHKPQSPVEEVSNDTKHGISDIYDRI